MLKPLYSMMSILMFVLGSAWLALAQVNTGELRMRVTDPAGVGLKAFVAISSEANQFRNAVITSDAGEVEIKTLAYGIYLVRVEKPGFATTTETLEVRSALPAEHTIRLTVEPVTTTVQVSSTVPLIDPDRSSSIMQIGFQQIQERVGSLPGRSVQDLVNSQPGWLYEGNAVLHPRGSEYQTQFVVDGIPLTDNRSPSFGPEIEADDVDSISVYTAGIPAEYGRKMGGVVELNTRRETGVGLHGQMVLSGGSYDTAASYAQLQDVLGRNSFGVSASGSMSAHYLNPVVPGNYTNRGTTGDFSANYERDLSQSDRLSLSVRHELSRYEIPNELVQEQADQLQTGDNFETLGTVRYQHILSPDSLLSFAGMVRDNSNDLYSNQNSTPIIAAQHNNFREGYFKAAYSLHHGMQEFRAGVESDTVFLHENFSYSITDPTQFDPGTPTSPPAFFGNGTDLEPSVFVEDLVRLGKWTVSAGLRWDHYQLLLNQNAFSPRISLGRSVPSLKKAGGGRGSAGVKLCGIGDGVKVSCRNTCTQLPPLNSCMPWCASTLLEVAFAKIVVLCGDNWGRVLVGVQIVGVVAHHTGKRKQTVRREDVLVADCSEGLKVITGLQLVRLFLHKFIGNLVTRQFMTNAQAEPVALR